MLYQIRTVESRMPEPPEAKLAPLRKAAEPIVFLVELLTASPMPPLLLLPAMRERYGGGLLLKPMYTAAKFTLIRGSSSIT
jgi:hypothetical protein